MEILRLKPYKACDPYSTIHKIRTILKDCNIFTTETNFTVNSNLYSCSVRISNNRLDTFNIQTNGKGNSPAYALASAYGEFMERLQNNKLFKDVIKYAYKGFLENSDHNSYFNDKLINEKLLLNFIKAPDELLLTYNELDINKKQIFQDLIPYEEKSSLEFIDLTKNNKFVWLPFYNVKNKNVVHLPIDLLHLNTSTNGLCAGNTKEEAIIQGICEIFERYAIKEIFQKELTPPTIPSELFINTDIYKKLENIKSEFNFNYIIKDCSLGIGLPVIGLILINYNDNKYFFKLGSDVSPITALERCLTEIYQGMDTYYNPFFKNIDFSKNNFIDEDYKKELRNIELDKIFRDGYGSWPNSIFLNKESYVFNGFEYSTTKSDKEDLNYLVKKIDSLGYELYIRDVSYLGFPAFNIYIPKISHIDFTYSEKSKFSKNYINDFFINYDKIKTIYRLRNSTLKEIQDFSITNNILNSNGNFSLFPYNFDDENKIDENIFATMLFYRIKDYKRSFEYLNTYIKKIEENYKTENFYYYCIRDYIFLKSKHKDEIEIIKILSNVYKDDLLSEVVNDLKSEENIFNKAKLPNCFNCQECEINEKCSFLDILKVVKNLQVIYSKNIIDQLVMEELFILPK